MSEKECLPHETIQNEEEQGNKSPAVYAVDVGSSTQRFSPVRATKNKRYDDDDFWDLGEVRRKVYQKPAFADTPVVNVPVEQDVPANPHDVKREPIPTPPPAPAFSVPTRNRAADNTVSPSKKASANQVQTSRYTSNAARDVQNRQNEALRNMKASAVYDTNGLLIRHVEIKPWTSGIPFYQRFTTEAALFHQRKGVPCEAVSFVAYVPQYSKMNERQQNYYLYVRDSIREGRHPKADLPYILLYIYEIINLPHLIPPAEGVERLADIWLNYRDRLPTLDIFLCEWMADYCLIHQCPLPPSLHPILPQIVQKAQFKEFFLNDFGVGDMSTLADTLMEFSSDYDYRRSRYYKGNEAAYDKQIPEAVTEALTRACMEKRGIFALEKKYRLTRDAYCGAVTPAEIKKRIDVEFCSFTRPFETRRIITDLVKYAENRLRLTLKIKAKLGVGELSEADRAVIDRFFAPMMPVTVPTKAAVRAAEEQAYLRLYEADTAGFDFAAATEIERSSWDNTGILTDAELSEGEAERSHPVVTAIDESPPPSEKIAPPPADTTEKEALRAALDGCFRSYCKERGLFAGDVVSKINEIFLDRIGDIVLTDEDGDVQLIEDYREDVTQWLN